MRQQGARHAGDDGGRQALGECRDTPIAMPTPSRNSASAFYSRDASQEKFGQSGGCQFHIMIDISAIYR